MEAKSQIWCKEKRKMNSHTLAENRQKEESRSTVYLFTRRHQVLVGLEDVSESFFDVFFFHARQHCGRQEQRQTPLLPADAQKQKWKKGHSSTTTNSQLIILFLWLIYPEAVREFMDRVQSKWSSNQRCIFWCCSSACEVIISFYCLSGLKFKCDLQLVEAK